MVTGIPVMKAGKLFKRCLEESVEQEKRLEFRMSLGRDMIDICDFCIQRVDSPFQSQNPSFIVEERVIVIG